MSRRRATDLVEATLATLNKLYEKNAEQEKNNA